MAYSRRRTVVALTALLTVAAGLPGTPAPAAPPPTTAPARTAAPGPERWSVDLAVAGGDDVNVAWRSGRLRLADPRPTARTRPAAVGILLSAPRALDRPATRVRAQLTARTGDGVRPWRRCAAGVPAAGPSGETPPRRSSTHRSAGSRRAWC